MYTPLQPSWCSWGGEYLGAKGPEAGTSLAEEHLPGQDAKGQGLSGAACGSEGLRQGEVGGGEEAAVVAAGSQERRMAERQANGRPGTDKGMGAGTLEAWVRGPGRGQCWYLILWAAFL